MSTIGAPAPIAHDHGGMMAKLILDISMSLDGFVAGPNPTLEEPLGQGGGWLHEWAFATKAFRERHGHPDGESNVDSSLVEESIGKAGATIMGRRMYSGGEGDWADDPNADGWWGENPPFHHPVFVLTRHGREPVTLQDGTTFTFVTDGIEAALEQARTAAGGRDVVVGGGASAAQQYLGAGLLDELEIHLVPVLLGSGTRLLDGNLVQGPGGLQRTGVIESPSGTTHLSYRIVR
jgi:dihydrofolate reductase